MDRNPIKRPAGMRPYHNKIVIGMDIDLAWSLARNPSSQHRTDYIDIRHHFIRRMVIEIGNLDIVLVAVTLWAVQTTMYDTGNG